MGVIKYKLVSIDFLYSLYSRNNQGGLRMRISHSSVFVDDQAKALEFYTAILGFVKKEDIPLGKFRWLTVVSAGAPDGPELLLEPNDNQAARTYQEAIFAQGIPAALFSVSDVAAEHERLKSVGVVFRTPPTETAAVTIAVFEDTCGNLIQIVQK